MMTEILKLALPLTAAGLVIGMLAAAFGVGGGVLNVPLIYFLLKRNGVDDGLAFKSALATSMFAMFFTSISAGLSHYKKKNYIVGASLWIVAGSLAGAQIGAAAAVYLDAEVLKKIFGCLLLFAAWNMLRKNDKGREDDKAGKHDSPAVFIALGFVTGILAALMGIGGGVIIVPTLCLALGHSFHKSVGTSIIVIIFISASASVHYMLSAPQAGLPYSAGYVSWLLALALAPGSMVGAMLGVRIMLKLNPKPLKLVFTVFIVFIAMKILGILNF